jgi:hypothetical protein
MLCVIRSVADICLSRRRGKRLRCCEYSRRIRDFADGTSAKLLPRHSGSVLLDTSGKWALRCRLPHGLRVREAAVTYMSSARLLGEISFLLQCLNLGCIGVPNLSRF